MDRRPALVGLVAAGFFPIQVAAFAAAVFVVLTGALTMEEAYRNIEWRAITFNPDSLDRSVIRSPVMPSA